MTPLVAMARPVLRSTNSSPSTLSNSMGSSVFGSAACRRKTAPPKTKSNIRRGKFFIRRAQLIKTTAHCQAGFGAWVRRWRGVYKYDYSDKKFDNKAAKGVNENRR